MDNLFCQPINLFSSLDISISWPINKKPMSERLWEPAANWNQNRYLFGVVEINSNWVTSIFIWSSSNQFKLDQIIYISSITHLSQTIRSLESEMQKPRQDLAFAHVCQSRPCSPLKMNWKSSQALIPFALAGFFYIFFCLIPLSLLLVSFLLICFSSLFSFSFWDFFNF